MGLKVLSMRELLMSHILLVGGLVLITIGLLQEAVVLNIIGLWAVAMGLCVGFGAIFKKLLSK